MSMPHFGKASFSKLSTCHPDLQTLFYEVIKSFDCAVLEGHRSKEDQEAAFKAGNTELHWPSGKHNSLPSMAVDVAPYPIDLNNTKRFYWFAGYVMGIASRLKDEGKMTHGVRYGGDWNSNKEIDDQTFKDLVHFELIS
jgi:peptidoglycan L-alanyl-D-glutamate endopeptidase CwlK